MQTGGGGVKKPAEPGRPGKPKAVEETPAGRGGSLDTHHTEDKVDEASEESFPASDPPAWSPVLAA